MKPHIMCLLGICFLLGCHESVEEKQSSRVLLDVDENMIKNEYELTLVKSMFTLRGPGRNQGDSLKKALAGLSISKIQYLDFIQGFVLQFPGEPNKTDIKEALRDNCYHCNIDPVFVTRGSYCLVVGNVMLAIKNDFRTFTEEDRKAFMETTKIGSITDMSFRRNNETTMTVLPQLGVDPFEVVVRVKRLEMARYASVNLAYKLQFFDE